MGLFGNLFKKDPQKETERIEEQLRRESYVQALDSAKRFAASAEGKWQARADELVERCRRELVDSIVAKADAAEREGNPADAADWLGSALDRLPDDDPRAPELRERHDRLRREIEEAEEDAWAARAEGAGPGPDGPDVDDDLQWQALVSMLRDEIAERYEAQPPTFREAVVHLNEARTGEASEILDPLLAEAPGDPILRLERGRCRLLADDAAGAREDFEAAWEALGDDPLDLAGAFSVPDLWAEAALASGDAEAVIDRLEELAAPEAGRPTLTEQYAAALIEGKHHPEARAFLARAASLHPERSSFPFLLAKTLRAADEPGLALECLETAVGPSCASGSCGGRRRHVPSVRLLARLHLEAEEGDPDRAVELLTLVARDQGGRRTIEDLELLARYQEHAGNGEAASRLLEEAERLRDSGETATDTSYRPPALGPAGRRSVL